MTECKHEKIMCMCEFDRQRKEWIKDECNRVLDEVDDWNNFMNESVSHVKLKRKITALRQSQTKEGEK